MSAQPMAGVEPRDMKLEGFDPSIEGPQTKAQAEINVIVYHERQDVKSKIVIQKSDKEFKVKMDAAAKNMKFKPQQETDTHVIFEEITENENGKPRVYLTKYKGKWGALSEWTYGVQNADGKWIKPSHLRTYVLGSPTYQEEDLSRAKEHLRNIGYTDIIDLKWEDFKLLR